MKINTLLERLGLNFPLLRAQLRYRWRKLGHRVKRAVLCVLITFVHTILFSSPLGRDLEDSMRHTWFSLRGNRPISKAVTIVRLDIPAYQKIGVSPGERFPRKYLAEALHRIAAAQPKLIIIDFLMQAQSEDPEGDAALAAAIAQTPTFIAEASERIVNTDAEGNQNPGEIIKRSIPQFTKAAKGIITLETGVAQNGLAETIALPLGDSLQEVRFPLVSPLRRYVDPTVITPGNLDYINYYGKTGTLSSISLGKLIGDETPDPALFRDRVVFVGMMTDSRLGISHLYDVLEIPIERSSMFGVEIQANIAGNLLDRSWIRRLQPEQEVITLSVLVFVLTFIFATVKPLAGFFTLALAAAAWLGASYYSFTSLFVFLPGASFCLLVTPALLLVRPAGLAFQKWREARR